MKVKQKLLHYWHDLYYALAPEKGIEFAMKCRDVTEKLDLNQVPTDFWGRLRFSLHLSLCSLCNDYSKLTNFLKNAAISHISLKINTERVQKFNRDLMKQFGATK